MFQETKTQTIFFTRSDWTKDEPADRQTNCQTNMDNYLAKADTGKRDSQGKLQRWFIFREDACLG